MAVWSVISRFYLRESTRIDAEYQKPNDIKLEADFIASGSLFLKKYLEGFCSGKNLAQFDKPGKDVVPYIRTQNVRPFLISEDGISYSRYTASATVDYGDILAVRVGAGVGDLSVVCKKHAGSCISDNVLRIRVSGVNPFYLLTFLLSRYGQQFLQKTQKGTARGLISKEKFFFVPVPNILPTEQSWYEMAINKAEELGVVSENLYTQAQHLLESELGLDKLTFEKPVGYTARFSELEQSRRADPEHFYPAFNNLSANLPRSIKLVPIGPQLDFCQRGKQPVYAEKGLPVINSKHVQNNKVVFEGNRLAILSNGNDPQIRYGDILMNGTGRGTLGRAAPYLLENPAIPDNHVTILRSAILDPAYLSFYLNSQAGQLQVEMHQRGTSGQLELYPFDIQEFLVWVAPESLQKEIRKLYDQAAENERRSRELLNQAKSRVEQLIEEAAEARRGNV